MMFSVTKKIVIGFGLALILLIFIGVASYQSTKHLIQDSNQKLQTQDALEHLNGLLSMLVDAETGERGYIITGRDEFLEPFNVALRGLDAEIERVSELTTESSEQQKRISEVSALAARKIAIMQDKIDVLRNTGLAAAQQAVATGEGKEIMDHIRVIINSMKDDETQLLLERSARAQARGRTTIAIIAAGSLLALIVVALAIFFINRDLKERQLAAKNLRESEERFRHLLEGIRDYAIFMIDEDGKIASWSTGAQKVLGYQTEEIIGRHFSCLYPEQDIRADKPGQHLQLAAATGRFEEEGRRIRKDGSLFWANMVITALHYPDGQAPGFVTITRDMTERKKAEEALRMQAQIIDQIHDSVVSTNLDGEITCWNGGAERLFGYEVREALGKPISFLFPEDQYEFLQHQVLQPLMEKEEHEIEARMRRKSGEEFDVQVLLSLLRDRAGSVQGIIAYSIDITQRKQAEQAVRESESRYRGLVESLTEAIFIEQDGRLVYINPSGLYLLGYGDLIELNGCGMKELFEETAETPIEKFERMDKNKETPSLLEGRLIGKDGRVKDLELTFIHVMYQGSPAIQAVARDITEAKTLRLMNERMQRLAALGQLSTTIAHEIRNPLGSISLNLENLRNRGLIPKDSVRVLDNISHGIMRIKNIISGILDFARPVAPRFKKTNLHNVLSISIHSVKQELKQAGIFMQKNYQDDETEVLIDPDQIVQVFVNLFLNAKDAMTPGGYLTINTMSNGNCVDVEVMDEGEGISGEILDKIFNPFFTTKKDGIGLGLAVVHSVLEQNQARIFVESKVGAGTKFKISFQKAS